MPNYFPPKPAYPQNYDDDKTLYLVFNTSETVTTADNEPWSSTINVKPVKPNENEIWAENGYANINGELFYYDSVGKDVNGKINQFRRCSRNLGGSQTRFQNAGTEVRGYIVAEHHNQLADSIIKLEKFIGYNFTEDKNTLDWKIRNLQQLPAIFDDHTCPNISFNFYIESESPSSGIIARYEVVIDGTFTSYRLDFGDGEFTTNSTSGTHRYAPNATIDPVATITNSKCTIIQSPIERLIAAEPKSPEVATAFEIPIPEIPNFPILNIPDIPIPSNIVTPPPIVFPCLDIGPINVPSVIVIDPPIPSEITIGGITIPSVVSIVGISSIAINPVNIPSLINFGPIKIPSLISFGPVNIPTLINFGPLKIPSLINFGPLKIPSLINFGPINIPTLIDFGPVDIPNMISFGPVDIPNIINFGTVDLPSVINFGPIPTVDVNITIDFPDVNNYISFGPAPFIPCIISFGVAPFIPSLISFGPAPRLGPVYFGPAPTLSITWGTPPTLSCVVSLVCPSSSPTPGFRAMGLDDFEDEQPMLEVSDLGIPSEIFLRVPEIPDIKILHDIPALIRVESPKIQDIKIIGPDIALPNEIKINAQSIPSSIELLGSNIPSVITIDSSSIPSSIKLELPENMPTIKFDTTGIPDKIQVVGIPSAIELKGAPSEIKLVMPENPEIPLVYKGSPIDVKINLDVSRLTGEDGSSQCVTIVPCVQK